jgi:hypothetical protein
MYGDFSRLTFSRAKAYTGVWSQQGRVQLDADANEQTAIVLDWLRTLAVDFIGPFGGHVTRAGFHVGHQDGELTFSRGHYYVYGLRCDLPGRPGGEPVTYHGLVPGGQGLPEPPFLVQLLVWERSVSAVTDPGLLEPALGPCPPDTTVRSQVAWLPEVTAALPPPDGRKLTDVPAAQRNPGFISRAFEEYNEGGRRHPLLAARAEPDVETEEATIVPATAGYLGVENQLYRVEVHRGGRMGESRPTFKWSRDNGSAQFRITEIAESEKRAADPVLTVTVASLGRDDSTGLDVGDWAELTDDSWAPQGEPPPLLRVRAGDRANRVVTLDGDLRTDLSLTPCLRRWDQGADGHAGPEGIAVAESSDDGEVWIELEDGVEVRFQANKAEYRRGDYWLIPARTATGNVLWPGGQGAAVPPFGPARYLVPLALVTSDGVTDLRTLFTHLAWPDGSETNGGQTNGGEPAHG